MLGCSTRGTRPKRPLKARQLLDQCYSVLSLLTSNVSLQLWISIISPERVVYSSRGAFDGCGGWRSLLKLRGLLQLLLLLLLLY